ncbi:hypothetical protein Rleg_5465 (plasmid) [Rhizobium leguminosarum bv. trifolii WSM1325]|uniref:Reverse transcriptase domain-containing protein n=1 Tax=Rhizobium leguminosarum bv. trifolii (strain WSM1325) TaxID=395491 RepID=C6B8P7_RHILS|nr:reverse transcriptase domain-containing protein [Rhizobium leguminosarum]ACS60285.1 hypothetical protein Rleg_5465 [Rhizobium leguminosarum bv. trifolii WSM1325]
MAHEFENFLHSYWKDDKPIFSPSEFGRELGNKLKAKVEKAYKFDSFVYHFKDGSHVVALHAHRKNQYFCRVDLQKFFYSIKRNRLRRALRTIGIEKPEYYAKWSTVKNPFPDGGYVVPYGFIQSPILATLVLSASAIGEFIRGLHPAITASVYMDDICLSSGDEHALWVAFEGLKVAVEEANFTLNADKTREPAPQIDIFNISLESGDTQVLPQRVEQFFENERTQAGIDSFQTYCDIVASHKWQTGDGRRRRRRMYWQRRNARAAATPAAVVEPQVAPLSNEAAMNALMDKVFERNFP